VVVLAEDTVRSASSIEGNGSMGQPTFKMSSSSALRSACLNHRSSRRSMQNETAGQILADEATGAAPGYSATTSCSRLTSRRCSRHPARPGCINSTAGVCAPLPPARTSRSTWRPGWLHSESVGGARKAEMARGRLEGAQAVERWQSITHPGSRLSGISRLSCIRFSRSTAQFISLVAALAPAISLPINCCC
jgi:hypothetical protein